MDGMTGILENGRLKNYIIPRMMFTISITSTTVMYPSWFMSLNCQK